MVSVRIRNRAGLRHRYSYEGPAEGRRIEVALRKTRGVSRAIARRLAEAHFDDIRTNRED